MEQLLYPEEIKAIRYQNQDIDYDPEIFQELRQIEYDSRFVEPGDLFVAIVGYVTDGHRYIDKAVEKGAKYILCENLPEKLDQDVYYIQVENTRAMLGVLASRYFDHPSETLNVIGVTGTNGKTSITSFLKDIYTKNGEKVGLVGTIHNLIGDEEVDNKGRTTPESYDFQKLLHQMLEEGCSTVATEASSHALYLDRTNGTQYRYAVFTNLTQDHLDFHKTMQAYFDAKKKIFSLLAPNGKPIICLDDPAGKQLIEEMDQAVSYGFEDGADYQILDLKMHLHGSDFTLKTPKGLVAIHLPVMGKFMAQNAAGAAAVALEDGLDTAVVQEALSHPTPIMGRVDVLKTDAPFDVIIDYAHSPDSLEKLLQSVREVHHKGRLILVFGANGNRDQGKRVHMGEAAGKNADYIIVTSDNPDTEEVPAISAMVEEGVKKYTDQYELVNVREDAICHGAKLCQEGDVLVLAGKGHELCEIVHGVKLPYSEWDAAEKAVNQCGYQILKED